MIAKNTGTSINTWIVDVIMPPTIGAAIGFITSEPMPLSHRYRCETEHHDRDRHQFRSEALNCAFDSRRFDILSFTSPWPGVDPVPRANRSP